MASFGGELGEAQDAGGTPGTTVAVATTETVPAGGRLIIGVSWYGQFDNASVADNGPGLSWSEDAHIEGATPEDDVCLSVFSAHAPAGMTSGTTITVTYAPNPVYTRAIWGIHASGIPAASYLDDTATASAITTDVDVGPVTTTTDSALVVMAAKWEGGSPLAGAFTANGTETETHDFTNSAETRWVMTYRVAGAAGNYTPGGDFASVPVGNAEWVAIAAAYKSDVVTPAVILNITV